MAEETKRVYRSRDEMIAEVDKKIAFHKEKIAILEKRKAELAKPRAGRKSNKQKKFEELIATGKLTEEDATVLGYKAPKD